MLPPPNRHKSLCLRLAALTGVILILAVAAGAQSLNGFQAPQERKVKDDKPLTIKAAHGEVPFRKVNAKLAVSNTKVKRLPQLAKHTEKGKSDKLFHVGVVRSLKTPLDPRTDSDVHIIQTGVVRVAGVVSSGALAVRVQFKDMSLPAGARVFVYSMSNPDEYYGPFEGQGVSQDGTFWTPPVSGEGIVIEYFVPGATEPAYVPFKVSEIAHIYRPGAALAGACNPDVTPEWANVAKSVAMLQFVTGSSVAVCTGTLLNDSNPSLEHYVLTANHCISTQSEAQSAVAYWNYDTGETPPNGTASFAFDLVVTGGPSDFTLLRRGAVLSGLFFSGWDASPLGVGTSVTGIHHPSGSHKRIAFGGTNADCSVLPCTDFAGVTWSQGTTEPGSSGAGLWIGTPDNAKLVGTLTGGQASCDNLSGTDYYGRFSVTYPAISSFLQGTNCVTSISPTNQNFTEAGGNGAITVTAPAGCNWTAVPVEGFVSITGNASGSGDGSINFEVAANNGRQRGASIVIGGQVFKIFQTGGGPCAAVPIGFGQTIGGNLSTGDCPFGDGTYFDVYSFNATAGQRISVSMTSSEFDAYLFLNKPDGTNLYQNQNGGGGSNARIPAGSSYVTLPVTGTYMIWANAFSPQDTIGAYSLTLIEQQKHTLTILSSGANTPVNVTLPGGDLNGSGSGATPFTRTYYQTSAATLIAPSGVENKIFKEWQKDGVAVTTSTVVSVHMDADHTMTAVYRPAQHYVMTIDSTNAGGGATIYPSEKDLNGLDEGTTPFTRTYAERTGSNYILISAAYFAPNGNVFQKWQKNGIDVSSQSVVVTLDGNYTLNAFYVVPPTATLTVNSANPDSGVEITVSSADRAGLANGVTSFTRTYLQNTAVNLTAPQTLNGNVFEKWLLNGSHLSTNRSTWVGVTADVTATAVYIPPPARTLTIQSQHPSAGVNITVSPNDSSGLGNGTTPFSRTYSQFTSVSVTAPAVVGQNTFYEWRLGTSQRWSTNLTTSIPLEFNGTLTAIYFPGPPAVLTETGTNNISAVNSVTYLRGPFQILDPRNFSVDGHTRIVLLTTDLELEQQSNPDPVVIRVQAGGINLPVESVGRTSGGIANGSYIIVKLPDGLPKGNLSLTVTLRGLTSAPTTLPIGP